MDLFLNEKVVIVVAASQGLGFACALELAREGARIFLCSRDEGRASEAARKIHETTGTSVAGFAVDITDNESLSQFVHLVYEQAGRVDVLVTNSGGPKSGPMTALTTDDFQTAFDLNLVPVVQLTRLVLPGMRAQKWGRVINLTSISAKQPLEGGMLSNTMRAAITGWSKTLAAEVALDNVTVNNVAPGYTLTEKQQEHAEVRGKSSGITSDEMIAYWSSLAPMNRLAQPSEIGAVVAFLASERASYVTGTTIQVDGGFIRSLF